MGGLDDKVSEGLLWELFVQAGPVVNVHMPKDRVTQQHQGYGFVEFMGEEDADYAIKIMNMIKVSLSCCTIGLEQNLPFSHYRDQELDSWNASQID